MRKRTSIVAVLLVLVLLALAACGGAQGQSTAQSQAPAADGAASAAPAEPEAEPAAPEAQNADFKIAALLSGVITDNGWSANMYQAITDLTANYGVVSDYVESVTVSDMEEHLRAYASDGYNAVVAHGSQFIDIVNTVAPDFPDTMFIISYATMDVSEHANVACVAPVNNGFLAGIAAGALTETNKIAMLGSEENPAITLELNSFGPGAKLVNPDVEVITGYIGSASDLDKGKEMALNLIDGGVDVVCHSANSAGLGVLQAAEEAGVMAIGFNNDQYESAPGAVVTSSMRDFPAIYDDLYQEMTNGSFTGGLYQYGIAKQGCKLAPWHGWEDTIAPEKIELINETIQKFIDGELEEKVIWDE